MQTQHEVSCSRSADEWSVKLKWYDCFCSRSQTFTPTIGCSYEGSTWLVWFWFCKCMRSESVELSVIPLSKMLHAVLGRSPSEVKQICTVVWYTPEI